MDAVWRGGGVEAGCVSVLDADCMLFLRRFQGVQCAGGCGCNTV